MKTASGILIAALACLAAACSVPVHEDYPRYLESHHGKTVYPRVSESVKYYLAPGTDRHSYRIRSARAGLYLNKWEVDFGRIMDSTMTSSDLRSAFPSVRKVANPYDKEGLLLVMDLVSYEFRDFEARVTLGVDARQDGDRILSRTYRAVGRSQRGKVVWGGSLAMKNAVQQSTKSAVDEIMSEIVLDLNKAVAVAKLDQAKEADEKQAGIGAELDALERSKEQRDRQEPEKADDEETITWREPNGNDSDSESVSQEVTSNAEEYCREYQSSVTIDGRAQETHGTACLQPDGTWRIVN